MTRALCALAACLPPLVIYARTMAPGLLARGDVPKFQFLGAILGTAHAPGYPLFIQLSWLFSQLPVGSVAWRVNLMTMLFGVAAAGTTAWVARACGASRPAALIAAWGLAFGPVFWEQCTAAEVYSLAVLLHTIVIGLVLRWERTRRDGHLLQAVAVSALALGHHPTFAMTAPALAVFVLLVDWRVVTRVRVMVTSAGLLVLGLAQYLFVVWRTNVGGLYVEARAYRLSDLLELFRGAQFEEHLFAFTTSELVATRVPFIGRFVIDELTWAGLALAAVGLVVMARQAPRRALLLGLTALIIFAFAASYGVGDAHVFVIPVFVVGWIAAAVGLSAAATHIAPRHAAALAVAVAIGLSSWNVGRSFRSRDLSRETFDDEYATALLTQVRTPSTILFDYYDPMSHGLRYKLYAERSGQRVRIGYAGESADPDADYAGERPTYVTEPSREILEARGLRFGLVEFDRRLTDRLEALPPDALVALALPPGSAAWLSPDDVRFLQTLGARRLPDAQAFVLVTSDRAPVAEGAGAAAAVDVTVRERRVAAEWSADGARIAVAGSTWRSDRAGLVVAVDARGELIWVEELLRPAGLRPTFGSTRRAIFRAVGTAECAETTTGWAAFDDADRIGTRLSAWMPVPQPREGRSASANLVVWALADDAPPVIAGRSLGEGRPIELSIETFDRAVPAEGVALAGAISRDGAPFPEHGRFATRVTGRMSGQEFGVAGISALVGISPRPVALYARGVGSGPVRFCLPPVTGAVIFGDASESRRELIRGQSDAIGPGWHGPEGTGADRLRWTSAARSVVRFSMVEPIDVHVRLDGGPQVVNAGETIQLIVNGTPLETRPLREGVSSYDWPVPAERLRAGFNELTLLTPEPRSPLDLGRGQDPRPLGFGAQALTLERIAR